MTPTGTLDALLVEQRVFRPSPATVIEANVKPHDLAEAARLAGADHDALREFLGNPGNAALMSLFVLASIYHGLLGMQEVIVDYVHCKKGLVLSLLLIKFLAAALAAFLVLSVIKLGFGV